MSEDDKLHPRKQDQFKVFEKEASNDEKNDNEMLNLFVKFQHPFDILSQFDQFKVIFWQNDGHTNKLSPQLRETLKLILETEWVGDKTRRLVHISK